MMLNEIRVKFSTDRVEYSKHAVDGSIIRHITVGELREAVAAAGENHHRLRAGRGQVDRLSQEAYTLNDHRVTYTIEYQGRFYLVENVPARLDEQTGEPCFSPDTVERLQQLIHGEQKPKRTIETPVYMFHESAA